MRAVSTASRDDLGEVDRLALERPALVEPGEQQQVLDEHAHALALAADPGHRAGEVVGPPVGAALEQLGVGANGRERRAQLVRGVGDEAAQPRSVASASKPLDRQHRVQRQPEPADLGSLLRALDAAARGRRRRSRRPSCRSPRAAAARAGRSRARAPTIAGEHGGGDEQLDQEQPVQRAVDVAQRAWR